MKRYLFAAAAAAAIASPAAARDGSGYAGIEAGLFIPQKSDVDRIGPPVTSGIWADWLNIKHDLGYDADLVAGYDFGMFRLEAEVARKHAGHSSYDIDTNAPGPFPAGIVRGGSYPANGRTNVTSFMVNALIDADVGNGFSVYAGAGAGPALVSMTARRFRLSPARLGHDRVAGNRGLPGAGLSEPRCRPQVPVFLRGHAAGRPVRASVRRTVVRPLPLGAGVADLQLRRCGGSAASASAAAATSAASAGHSDVPGRQRDRRDGDLSGAASASPAAASGAAW
jgi:opacity protein-like surface antigen